MKISNDDFENDEHTTEEEEREPVYTKRSFQIICGLVFLVVVFFGSAALKSCQRTKPTTKTTQVAKKTKKKKVESEPSQSKPVTVEDLTPSKPEERAKQRLEMPDKTVSDKDREVVATAIQKMVDYVKNAKEPNPKPTYESQTQISSPSMLGTLRTAQLAGYTFDKASVKAYKSKADNVIQYTFAMKKANESDLVYTGNYVTGTGQMELANFVGQIQGAAGS